MEHLASRIALLATASLARACTLRTPAVSPPEVPAALQAPPGAAAIHVPTGPGRKEPV